MANNFTIKGKRSYILTNKCSKRNERIEEAWSRISSECR